jgi:hypothetical protein
MASEWQCQFCNLRCELPEDVVQRSGTTLLMDNASGPRVFFITLMVCPNRNCRQLHAVLDMYEMKKDERGTLTPGESPLKRWQLIPSTTARQLPDFVPEAVRKEYEQATGVKEISPDASATLARRCLQNIVRDFWGVREKFLHEELEAARTKIDPDTWDAIEAVRQTGMIGRHMEKAINLILDSEAEEPDILLGLIEYLIDEWYIARRQRQERLSKLKGVRVPERESQVSATPQAARPEPEPPPIDMEPLEEAEEVDEPARRPPRKPSPASPTSYSHSSPRPAPPVIPPSPPPPAPSATPPVIPVAPSSNGPSPPPISRRPPKIKDMK